MTGTRVFEAPWASHGPALAAVRRKVFVDEQGIAEDEEWDGQDDACRHFLAADAAGRPVGTARLLPSGQIGRMAVLPAWRGRGIGTQLLALAVATARKAGMARIFLHAQADKVAFYERAGFEAHGELFTDAGILHREMTLRG